VQLRELQAKQKLAAELAKQLGATSVSILLFQTCLVCSRALCMRAFWRAMRNNHAYYTMTHYFRLQFSDGLLPLLHFRS
jgi:hypothetical protein